MENKEKALVLLSGGQDSTTCLYWAIQFYDVQALNIVYGQRHKLEIEAAGKIANLANIPLERISLSALQQIDDSALLQTETNISKQHRSSDELPASFVPGRNILFLTVAAAYAYKHGIKKIITGVCETDYSGYPDCRDNTIKSLQVTLSLGMDTEFEIITPLMHFTKAQTVMFAKHLNGCMEALAMSHTCYEGVYPPCGECPACKLRAKGFNEVGITDPLLENQND